MQLLNTYCGTHGVRHNLHWGCFFCKSIRKNNDYSYKYNKKPRHEYHLRESTQSKAILRNSIKNFNVIVFCRSQRYVNLASTINVKISDIPPVRQLAFVEFYIRMSFFLFKWQSLCEIKPRKCVKCLDGRAE